MKNLTKSEQEVFEMKAKAAWNKDTQLQADFNSDFSRYLAYLERNDDVKFKILGGK